MRDRIIAAAAEEINFRGFKFTMSDLTKRLNVSKTSLYEHFSSKNELIAVIIAMAIQETEEEENRIYGDRGLSIGDTFRAILTAGPKQFGPLNDRIYDDLYNFYPAEWQRIAEYRDRRLTRLTDFLLKGIEKQVIRPVNLPVLRQMLVGAVGHLIRSNRFLTENNMTYSDAVAAMADIIMYGLQQTAVEQRGNE